MDAVAEEALRPSPDLAIPTPDGPYDASAQIPQLRVVVRHESDSTDEPSLSCSFGSENDRSERSDRFRRSRSRHSSSSRRTESDPDLFSGLTRSLSTRKDGRAPPNMDPTVSRTTSARRILKQPNTKELLTPATEQRTQKRCPSCLKTRNWAWILIILNGLFALMGIAFVTLAFTLMNRVIPSWSKWLIVLGVFVICIATVGGLSARALLRKQKNKYKLRHQVMLYVYIICLLGIITFEVYLLAVAASYMSDVHSPMTSEARGDLDGYFVERLTRDPQEWVQMQDRQQCCGYDSSLKHLATGRYCPNSTLPSSAGSYVPSCRELVLVTVKPYFEGMLAAVALLMLAEFLALWGAITITCGTTKGTKWRGLKRTSTKAESRVKELEGIVEALQSQLKEASFSHSRSRSRVRRYSRQGTIGMLPPLSPLNGQGPLLSTSETLSLRAEVGEVDEELVTWLTSIDVDVTESLKELLAFERIDMKVVDTLTEEAIRDLDMPLGDRCKIIKALEEQRKRERVKSKDSQEAYSSSESDLDEDIAPETEFVKGSRLGEGGSGHVFQAMLVNTGKLVAVKEISLKAHGSLDVRNRIFAEIAGEIRLLRTLRHRHIVRFIDAMMDDSMLYVHILMELVSGNSLHCIIQTVGVLKEPVVRLYVQQLLGALSYCHEKGVVHRDVKARNVLVGTHGNIKLCDFGSAADSATATSDYRATALWLAPEIAKGEFGDKVDVWALGCTILEMTTGTMPWAEKKFQSVEEAQNHIFNSDEIPAFPDNVSAGLIDFLTQCFQRSPAKRSSAKDLLNHPWMSTTSPTPTAETPRKQGSASLLKYLEGHLDPAQKEKMKVLNTQAKSQQTRGWRILRTTVMAKNAFNPRRTNPVTQGKLLPVSALHQTAALSLARVFDAFPARRPAVTPPHQGERLLIKVDELKPPGKTSISSQFHPSRTVPTRPRSISGAFRSNSPFNKDVLALPEPAMALPSRAARHTSNAIKPAPRSPFGNGQPATGEHGVTTVHFAGGTSLGSNDRADDHSRRRNGHGERGNDNDDDANDNDNENRHSSRGEKSGEKDSGNGNDNDNEHDHDNNNDDNNDDSNDDNNDDNDKADADSRNDSPGFCLTLPTSDSPKSTGFCLTLPTSDSPKNTGFSLTLPGTEDASTGISIACGSDTEESEISIVGMGEVSGSSSGPEQLSKTGTMLTVTGSVVSHGHQGGLRIGKRGKMSVGGKQFAPKKFGKGGGILDRLRQATLSPECVLELDILGRGQCVVYKALELSTMTLIALKNIDIYNSNIFHQARNELEAYAKLTSSYVVGFLGAYSEPNEGRVRLGSEFMDLGSLKDVVDKKGVLSENSLQHVGFQFARGLAYLEEKNQLHRDIKPDNVLLDHRGNVKIADFGLNKELSATDQFAHSAKGTVSYLSPERLVTQTYSFPSDVWSYGLSMLYAATGSLPFTAAEWDVYEAVVKRASPSLPRDEFSERFCNVIDRCLDKDPTTRITATELLDHPFFENVTHPNAPPRTSTPLRPRSLSPQSPPPTTTTTTTTTIGPAWKAPSWQQWETRCLEMFASNRDRCLSDLRLILDGIKALHDAARKRGSSPPPGMPAPIGDGEESPTALLKRAQMTRLAEQLGLDTAEIVREERLARLR